MRMYLFCIQAAVAAMVLNVAELQAGDSSVVRLTEAADSLRMEYRFEDAAAIYREASSTAADSLEKIAVEEKLLLAENGISMTGFVSTPKVVARHRFSLEDFYLFYPLEDSCWVSVPNQLDTAGANHFSRATYLPGTVASAGTGDKIYYSAPDASGAMNIYMTEYRDSLWSLPSLLTESMTSSSDEIYPMLSPDGKTMYFSSSGLYGAGGYDIYMTEWDEDASEWGEPVNLGFPYSSPYDDFLYVNTPDGKYSIFASNRDCSRDSVCVYVLEYDPMPVRKEVRDIQELRRICALDPDDALTGPNSVDTGTSVSDTMPDNVDIRRYMEKVSEVRLYRDSLYGCISSIDNDRQALPATEYEEDRKAISDRIAANEKMIPRLQASLDRAMSDLQKIEMEFLFNGVVIDPGKIQAESDREVVGASTGFVFTKMNPGTMPEMKFEVPEKKFDYTFMILPEGRFAEDNTLPPGLVYQIQIFSLSRKASVRQLNGLSPVFESRSSSGRYIYRVGIFRTYNDVLSRLNAVKKAGFKTAYIVPLKDGQVIRMAEAKALEKEQKADETFRLLLVPAEGSLPEVAKAALQQFGAKDIARTEEDGTVKYVAGPFGSRKKAEEAAAAARAAGIPEVSVSVMK